jgi:hypothetical protein
VETILTEFLFYFDGYLLTREQSVSEIFLSDDSGQVWNDGERFLGAWMNYGAQVREVGFCLPEQK